MAVRCPSMCPLSRVPHGAIRAVRKGGHRVLTSVEWRAEDRTTRSSRAGRVAPATPTTEEDGMRPRISTTRHVRRRIGVLSAGALVAVMLPAPAVAGQQGAVTAGRSTASPAEALPYMDSRLPV